MTFTSEQLQAIKKGEPLPIVLPGGEECVVIRKDVYEQIKHVVEDDLPSSLALSRIMREVAGNEDLDSYQQYKR